ncbi:energy transducer TonB [Patescibacteria group bacterium]|nr:energy transducer TonB [Patescibacteria group bacterium]
MKYVQKNVSYPQEAKDQGIEGTVYVAFIVKADGTVTDIKIKRSVHELLDAEALRVITKMPQWDPGNVSLNMAIPIKFKLSDKDKKQ